MLLAMTAATAGVLLVAAAQKVRFAGPSVDYLMRSAGPIGLRRSHARVLYGFLTICESRLRYRPTAAASSMQRPDDANAGRVIRIMGRNRSSVRHTVSPRTGTHSIWRNHPGSFRSPRAFARHSVSDVQAMARSQAGSPTPHVPKSMTAANCVVEQKISLGDVSVDQRSTPSQRASSPFAQTSRASSTST